MTTRSSRASGSTRAVVDALDDALRRAGAPDGAVQEKDYLKSPLEHYGASAPAIRKAVRSALADAEQMIRASFTWAYVDNLRRTLRGPSWSDIRSSSELDRWKDESFWLRRSALFALLLPVRAGAGDWRRFTRYADAMLEEREFFIRKAIGWVLREASKKRPDRTRVYVESRLDRLSGLSFREAIKRLPAADQKQLRERRAA